MSFSYYYIHYRCPKLSRVVFKKTQVSVFPIVIALSFLAIRKCTLLIVLFPLPRVNLDFEGSAQHLSYFTTIQIYYPIRKVILPHITFTIIPFYCKKKKTCRFSLLAKVVVRLDVKNNISTLFPKREYAFLKSHFVKCKLQNTGIHFNIPNCNLKKKHAFFSI